jgi:1-acyl-sn-glycerol-3-phosphate acyltransferase
MKKTTLRSIVTFLVKGLTRTEFLGLENLPISGSLIIATNHMHYMDIPLLFINPVRADLTALVTTKYQKHWFIRWFCETAEGIWINRDIADFSAMQAASKVLKEGHALGISPEGTRSHTFQLIQAKPGTVLLALKMGVPIVPVAITGTEHAFRRIFTLQRPRFTIHFGPSFTLLPVGPENRELMYQQYTDEIMCRIAALMPEKYWGYYRDHPRLKELLASSSLQKER